ncbi:hypothetical protein DVA81_19930 [Acinetobacter baumannii]|nr:hypothetical protein DVA81_19930 [Acinetobacter baumannii]
MNMDRHVYKLQIDWLAEAYNLEAVILVLLIVFKANKNTALTQLHMNKLQHILYQMYSPNSRLSIICNKY